ncbi:DUF3613 domain-containing protein [Spongiibacter sp.]|uniref:DUF3613 domain-containing protein n=1 Tax=Spongiibacter sp. TaxID=2024860 RepID=UPI0035689149
MTKRTSLLTAALLFSGATLAADNEYNISRDSAAAKALAAQRAGESASLESQTLNGKARSASYKRYLDSFSQPIPKSFIEDSFTTE